jgi:DNA-binding IclR family transcriptional regulator
VAELGRIQRRGYAVDDEEVELGARCVAAPVLDSSGQVAAGISVSGPTIRMTRSRTTQIADVLKTAALEISTHLGYHTNPPEQG